MFCLLPGARTAMAEDARDNGSSVSTLYPDTLVSGSLVPSRKGSGHKTRSWEHNIQNFMIGFIWSGLFTPSIILTPPVNVPPLLSPSLLPPLPLCPSLPLPLLQSPTNNEFTEESNDEETIFTMLFQVTCYKSVSHMDGFSLSAPGELTSYSLPNSLYELAPVW